MKKNNKLIRKSNKNNRLTKRKVLIAIAAFAGVGSLIVAFSQASPADEYMTPAHKQAMIISVSNDKPLVVERLSDGSLNYVSRGRTIDVSGNGDLHCVPEGNGAITKRTLSNKELQQVEGVINTQNLEDGTADINAHTNLLDTNKAIVTYRNSGVTDQRLVDPKSKPAGIQKVEQLLERLCASAEQRVNPDQKPIPAAEEAELIQDKSGLRSILTPTAYAGDQPKSPTKPTYTINRDFENDQYAKISNERRARGLPPLTRLTCLDDVARGWAAYLASTNVWGQHNPNFAGQIDSKCGRIWYKVGENQGRGGSSGSIFHEYMQSRTHRDNILDPAFNRVGIGAYLRVNPDGTRRYYTVQNFMGCSGSCNPSSGVSYK